MRPAQICTAAFALVALAGAASTADIACSGTSLVAAFFFIVFCLASAGFATIFAVSFCAAVTFLNAVFLEIFAPPLRQPVSTDEHAQ